MHCDADFRLYLHGNEESDKGRTLVDMNAKCTDECGKCMCNRYNIYKAGVRTDL